MVSGFNYFKMLAWLLLHSAFILTMVKLLLKGEVGVCALSCQETYIVDHGKSWKNHGIMLLNFCGNPVPKNNTNSMLGLFKGLYKDCAICQRDGGIIAAFLEKIDLYLSLFKICKLHNYQFDIPKCALNLRDIFHQHFCFTYRSTFKTLLNPFYVDIS